MSQPTGGSNGFTGTINLDKRDSKPDWNAFLDKKAPKDAPNVLVILYDDTGQAAWSPYGGRIEMPTLELAARAERSIRADCPYLCPYRSASRGNV
jgi:hypothetical protein